MRLSTLFMFVLLANSLLAQTFTIDQASSHLGFEIRNFGATVEGTFTKFTGTIQFDVHNPADSKFTATIESASIETGIGMRNNHLRKKDYFNVTEFPNIQFTSKEVSIIKPGEGIISGKLTIKGTSKVISIPFRYEYEKGLARFIGTCKINRRDYNIGGYSVAMGDEVEVKLRIHTLEKK